MAELTTQDHWQAMWAREQARLKDEEAKRIRREEAIKRMEDELVAEDKAAAASAAAKKGK